MTKKLLKKAILFDLDNTLYDYDKVHKIALEKVYSIFSKEIKISKEEFKKIYNLSKSEVHRELSGTASAHSRSLYFQKVIEKTHHTIKPKMILKLYNCYWDTLIKNMKLFNGVKELLKDLKKSGIKIAIVSDFVTVIQLRKLQKLGIENYVDVLVTSEETGSEKPHSIMFLLALQKLEVNAKDAIFIGDNTINDIEGANAVNLDTVLFQHGDLSKEHDEDYRKPNFVIKEIQELKDIIGL